MGIPSNGDSGEARTGAEPDRVRLQTYPLS